MSANILVLRQDMQTIQTHLAELETRTSHLESRFAALLSLSVRLSGNENLNDLLKLILKLYHWTQALLALLMAIQTSRLAAGDPTAWLGLFVAAGGLAGSVAVEMEMSRPSY